MISSRDREILRELAKKQMEYANEPENIQRASEWMRHNQAIPGRPMIHLELWTVKVPFAVKSPKAHRFC